MNVLIDFAVLQHQKKSLCKGLISITDMELKNNTSTQQYVCMYSFRFSNDNIKLYGYNRGWPEKVGVTCFHQGS